MWRKLLFKAIPTNKHHDTWPLPLTKWLCYSLLFIIGIYVPMEFQVWTLNGPGVMPWTKTYNNNFPKSNNSAGRHGSFKTKPCRIMEIHSWQKCFEQMARHTDGQTDRWRPFPYLMPAFRQSIKKYVTSHNMHLSETRCPFFFNEKFQCLPY